MKLVTEFAAWWNIAESVSLSSCRVRWVLLASMICAASCDESSSGDRDQLSREEVVALIERNMNSWGTGNNDAIDTLHDDVILAFPGKRLNKAGVIEASKVWQSTLLDLRVRVSRIIVDGNQFAVEYMFAATDSSTGKRQAVGTVAIGEVRDGKLYVWKEYLDGRVSRMQARGELPVDETAEPYPWPDTAESRVP